VKWRRRRRSGDEPVTFFTACGGAPFIKHDERLLLIDNVESEVFRQARGKFAEQHSTRKQTTPGVERKCRPNFSSSQYRRAKIAGFHTSHSPPNGFYRLLTALRRSNTLILNAMREYRQ